MYVRTFNAFLRNIFVSVFICWSFHAALRLNEYALSKWRHSNAYNAIHADIISKQAKTVTFCFLFSIMWDDNLGWPSMSTIFHYNDAKISTMASPITSLTIVYSILFRRRSKKTPKVRVTGLCEGNSPGTSEFPAQMASYAEYVSIWWRHHVV